VVTGCRIAMLPFTHDQFIAVFAGYNAAVWPAQVFAYALLVAMLATIFRASRAGNRFIGASLALMWVWTGIAYHGMFFAAINSAALLFGALFVLQGVLLLHAAIVRQTLRFGTVDGASAWLGWGLVAYASVAYPLIGLWLGNRYPEMPMFGITPCPLTLFTFGVLLLTTAPVPRALLVIPLLWSIVGGSGAFLLSVPQDWALLASGIATLPILLPGRQPPRHAHCLSIARQSSIDGDQSPRACGSAPCLHPSPVGDDHEDPPAR
jgi:hypothetical protein